MKPKALVVHSQFDHRKGGSPGLTAWAVQALIQRYAVTLLTWEGPVSVQAVDQTFGTSLAAQEHSFRFLYGSPRVRLLLQASRIPHAKLRRHLLIRQARRIAPEFDLLVSCDEDMALGRPALQYIHEEPYFVPLHLRPAPPPWSTPGSHLSFRYQQAMDRFCNWLSGTTAGALRANRTLVNSNFVGRMVQRHLGVEAQTVYPPAVGSGPVVPWAEREEAFLCLGRWSADKELPKVIAIIEEVRQYRDVSLHLAGVPDSPALYSELQEQAARLPWLRLHCALSRAELGELMGRCRYGIHGKVVESFGMAGAEMLRAGCLVFLPQGGGQTEMLEGLESLLYSDQTDAVQKIETVLARPDLQRSLLAQTAQQAERFSPQRFMDDFSREVELFVTASGGTVDAPR